MGGLCVNISSGSLCQSCRTDEQGYYEATDLSPGRYTAKIDSEGLEDREYRFSLAPTQRLRYDLDMSQCATLKGNIRTGSHGDLARAIRLVLRSETVTTSGDRHKFAGGGLNSANYEFKLLPPGKYELEAMSDIFGNVEYRFTLSAGETRVLDINLGRYGNLKGKAIGRDGEPLAGLLLRVLSPGRDLSVTTDSDGSYSLSDLSPGHIQVTIPQGQFAGTWHDFELTRPRKLPPIAWDQPSWPLVPEKAAEQLDIDLSPLGDVAGEILQADGKPLELAALKVESPHRSVEVITDREGRFRTEGLFPGQCRIHLPVPHLGRAYAFELAPKEQKELKILLPP